MNKLENTCSDLKGYGYMKINRKNFNKIFIEWNRILKVNEQLHNSQLEAQLFLNEIDKKAKLIEETGELLFIGEDKIEHKIYVTVADYKNFWNHYSRPVKPDERVRIESFKDRLIHISSRWQTGEFFTPLEIVQIAYDQFCEFYKMDVLNLKEYTFWDPCAGRGNLLYGYPGPTYENCFLSTLNQEDVDGMKTGGFYPGATIFQYNWLNQTDEELPEVVLNALKDRTRKWLFIMNPPWGKNDTCLNMRSDSKQTNNVINDMMKKDKLGKFSTELMYQSIYKLINLCLKYKLKCKICLICNTNLLFGVRNEFKNKMLELGFKLRNNSFIFNGNKSFGTTQIPAACCLIYDNEPDLQESNINFNLFYNNNNIGYYNYEFFTDSFLRNIKKQKNNTKGFLLNRNSLAITENINSPEKFLFYFEGDMMFNPKLFSCCSNKIGGYQGIFVNADNLNHILYFSFCSKFIKNSWFKFPLRVFDCSEYFNNNLNTLIYLSLHPTYGRTTSFSQTFENAPVSIRNPFFYLSKSEFSSLSNITRELYDDYNSAEEPWFIQYLSEHESELCGPAKELIRIVKEITKQTIQFRNTKLMATIKDEYIDTQLDTRWDAGWYQIRYGILENTNITVSDQVKDLYKEYKVKLKELENYLREVAKGLKLTDEVILYED